MIVQKAYSFLILFGNEILSLLPMIVLESNLQFCSQKIKELNYIFVDKLDRNWSYLGYFSLERGERVEAGRFI